MYSAYLYLLSKIASIFEKAFSMANINMASMKHHRQNIIEFSESIKNAELSLWPSRYFLFCKSFVCCIIKVLLLEKIDFEDFLFPQNLYNMEAIGVCSIMDKENWGYTINLSTKLSLEIRRENDSLQWWNRNLPRDQLFHDLFLIVNNIDWNTMIYCSRYKDCIKTMDTMVCTNSTIV